MPTKRSEKIKLYIVAALAVIAAVVAYIRFIHKGQDVPVIAADRPQPTAKLELPKIEKPQPHGPRSARFPSTEFFDLKIRNIFEPAALPPEPKAPEKKKPGKIKNAAPKPAPSLSLDLQGTITDGENPLAIINNKFYRVGQKIGDYRIVAIAPNTVYFEAGRHQKVVRVFNPEQK
jgi:hypothetical protein